MKTDEIRKRLIDEINSSNNVTLLEEMYSYFSRDNAVEEVYKLSEPQHREIAKGRDQIKSGQTLTNEEVNTEIQKWLDEK